MRTFILLLLYQVVSASAVTHSLQYFYTGSSGLHNFPEFLAVGVVDEVPIIYYDSIIQKAVSKQRWMNKVTEDDPQYWERESMGMIGTQQVFKSNIEIAKQRFNQTGGIHVVQLMYGCEWDDDTGEVRGYHQYGYDGKDFIAFDLKTETWIVPVLQAVITKNKWDHDVGWNKMIINYLTQECAHWLKKYVDYGRENLMRTVFPSVSLLQKTPSSPISCHATGFYPNRAEMFWRKDGVEIHEGVVKGEILPNDDGTFQMSANLEISSVIPEDWDRYDCVFQLSGLNEDIVIKLDKAVIKLNAGQSIIPVTVVVCVLMLQIIAVTFFIALYKRKTGSQISSASSHKKSITTTKPPIRNRKNSMDMGINLCCTELVSKCFCCPTDGDMVYYNHNITGYHTITITA